MKKYFLAIGVLMMFSSFIQAQYIQLKVQKVTTADPQMNEQINSYMGDMTLSIYTDGKQSATTFGLMGGMFNIKTITNIADQNYTMYYDLMGKKISVQPTKDELESAAKESEDIMKNTTIKKIEGQTKEILGYKCQKYMLKNDQLEMDMWMNDELKMPTQNIQGLEHFKLSGFPMEYTINANQLTMTIQAVKFEKEFDHNNLNPPTGNYEKMTLTEFKSKMGNIAGF